jgi:hypothetical protein
MLIALSSFAQVSGSIIQATDLMVSKQTFVRFSFVGAT